MRKNYQHILFYGEKIFNRYPVVYDNVFDDDENKKINIFDYFPTINDKKLSDEDSHDLHLTFLNIMYYNNM